ncbi:glycosyltransferase family 2 protein [Paenibacillus ehimensis]|uniref:Glycosyltransferase family A protein n=1 Tax=Paenibacillus ehimensis TaxID=79264 RepID=A0ABT8V6G5_9BACL|nr:glycosyltransferase family A protein [Paenibacillus ehimensis]MDO3677023.1 glycosyltransferase family A protein [Paenibacillus ehimensis]
MLFIVLDSRQGAPAEHTQASVSTVFPESRCIRLESHAAGGLNAALADYGEPWFVILYAGERLLPAFRRELESWVRSLKESEAGVLLTPVDADRHRLPVGGVPRGPVLWRTKAWRSGLCPGFAGPELLPFERYVLVEKQFQLSEAWHWPERQSSGWLPAVPRVPVTKKAADEWREVAPILKGRYSAAVAGQSPFVTVVLCTYNDAEYLVWAIRSVCVQSYPHWELLIVDDGSDDGSEEAVRACPFSADPRIRFVRCRRNMGKSHALNRALSLVRGRWLLELDADDWLTPDCLRLFFRPGCTRTRSIVPLRAPQAVARTSGSKPDRGTDRRAPEGADGRFAPERRITVGSPHVQRPKAEAAGRLVDHGPVRGTFVRRPSAFGATSAIRAAGGSARGRIPSEAANVKHNPPTPGPLCQVAAVDAGNAPGYGPVARLSRKNTYEFYILYKYRYLRRRGSVGGIGYFHCEKTVSYAEQRTLNELIRQKRFDPSTDEGGQRLREIHVQLPPFLTYGSYVGERD